MDLSILGFWYLTHPGHMREWGTIRNFTAEQTLNCPWFAPRVEASELNVLSWQASWIPRAAHLQAGDMRNHVGEQGIAGNVEGHTQAHVSRPLVQLAGQLAVHYVELAEGMAWGQGHLRKVCGSSTKRRCDSFREEFQVNNRKGQLGD